MPEFVLKKMLLSNLPQHAVEAQIADSIDFVVEQVPTIIIKQHLCFSFVFISSKLLFFLNITILLTLLLFVVFLYFFWFRFQLEGISQKELAAKMTLNCTPGPLKPQEFPLPSEKITIIDVLHFTVSLSSLFLFSLFFFKNLSSINLWWNLFFEVWLLIFLFDSFVCEWCRWWTKLQCLWNYVKKFKNFIQMHVSDSWKVEVIFPTSHVLMKSIC